MKVGTSREALTEELLDLLAARAPRAKDDRLAEAYRAALDRMDRDPAIAPETGERLRLFWHMLDAPDDVVAQKAKALLFAAVHFVVSPPGLVPDHGPFAILDHEMVIRVVHQRLAREVRTFQTATRPT